MKIWEMAARGKCFPGSLNSKESACNAGDLDSIPGQGRSPGGGHGNPLQYSCLEKSAWIEEPGGYSPWGRKELDMTERLNTAQPEGVCKLIKSHRRTDAAT